MSSSRRSNRRTAAAAANNDNIESSGGDDNDTNNPRLQAMRDRSRAVAEREASRLARPDSNLASRTLGHASKTKSAVSSTPFGMLMKNNTKGGSGVATNNNNDAQEWCGPFSVARQMIAAREEARRLRLQQTEEGESDNKEQHPLDHVMEEAKLEQQRKENPSMNWISRRHRTGNTNDTTNNSNANYYVKRRKRFHQQKELMGIGGNAVPSLFQLCIKYLVDNFEHVDSLGLVDHSIRVALCERLVAQGKMNGAAFDVLAEQGVETLELVDCAQVTEDQFCDAIKVLLPMGLRAILLKHCGRCFGGQAVKTIEELKREEIQLFALSLAGAYLLSDDDISRLIGATSTTLTSIDLTACPLIGPNFCSAIGEHFSSSIGDVTNCLLELSLEDIPLKKEALLSLGAASDALRSLKSLKLKAIEAVDDEVVSIVLNSIDEGSLEGIDLSSNTQLTDEVLSSIRRRGTNLRSLQLSGLRNLSAIALEAFFTPIDDMPSPPMLRKLDLSQCAHDEVSDSVLMLAAKASSFRSLADAVNSEVATSVNPENLVSEITNSLGLVHVNVSGASITDKSMEMLAATCKSSLEELDIGFCAGVSDKGLGYLVSKVGRQLSKIHVWGCAQITEDFLDGHDRVDEGGLEIVGVWMKKSGGRSLR